MSGIAGYCNLSGMPTDAGLIRVMTDTLRHRGPDGYGIVVDEAVALGHTRLAVVDPTEAAHQPMTTQDGLYTIVFDGEIYNHTRIQKELQSLGYAFTSRSSTETVLNAYREWGEQCVDIFNGMFSFCIHDIRKRKLFLARDRYGIKPLYYAFLGDVFVFGSESKCFLPHPAFTPKLDIEALTEYLTFQNILTDRTFFQNVHLFPQGCYARLILSGQPNLEISRYWDFHFSEASRPISLEEAEEELAFLFRQAVKRQLAADVEIGAYLSGGVDSGSITAVAAQELPYLKSFTCGFDMHSVSGIEIAYDERERSEHLSYMFKTEHYESILKSGDMERIIPRLVWHLEEPRLGQSYPNYFAAKLASRFVKAVFSGCGGDELFAGYPWRYYRVADCRSFEEYIDRYYVYWQRLIPNKKLIPLLKPIASQASHVWTRDIFCSVFGRERKEPENYTQSINLSLYFEAKTFLSGLLLVEDKISMAHGLETRLPFLDNDIVDFAVSLPVACKLANIEENIRINENMPAKSQCYDRKYADGKLILRRMMQRYVSTNVACTPKQGFSGPDATWFRGESIEYLQRTLMTPKARLWEYLDYSTAEALIAEHLSGKENRRLFIWSLLCVEWWLRKYL